MNWKHALQRGLAAITTTGLARGHLTSKKIWTQYERVDAIRYRRAEIQTAVEIATDNFTHLTAHVHATLAIGNAVECDCRRIEHGTYANHDLCGP